MNIVFLGIQGSGKGTEISAMRDKMDFMLISVGQMLRDEVAGGSALGQTIKSKMDKGELVDINIVISAIKNKLNTNDKPNIVFDGFPRNIEQMRALDKIMSVDRAIFLDLKKQDAVARIMNRLTCESCGFITKMDKSTQVCPVCGGKLVRRADDNIDALEKRFSIFEHETMPIVKEYEKRGILRKIDAVGTVEEVLNNIMKVL